MPPPLNAWANGPYLRRQCSPAATSAAPMAIPTRTRAVGPSHPLSMASFRKKATPKISATTPMRASQLPPTINSQFSRRTRASSPPNRGCSAGDVGTSPACGADGGSTLGCDGRAPCALSSDSVTCCSCPTRWRSCRRMDSTSSCSRRRRSSVVTSAWGSPSCKGSFAGIGAPHPAQNRPTEMLTW